LFFNNLVIRHIESSASQLSLFSLFSTISLLWTQFWASVDTTWTPRWTPNRTPNQPTQQRNLVYQMKQSFVVSRKLKHLYGLAPQLRLSLVHCLVFSYC
jgi:hypothetical protein